MKKRILAVLLASISLISLFGCKNNNKGNNSAPSGVVKPTVTDTIHEFSMETTPYSLVKNGATEYKILVSEKGKITHAEAISELQLFFEEATDIKLTAVTGENTFDSNAKYISLGETNFLQTADV